MPVGYPVEDIEILVVDDDGHAVRVGEVGELFIKSRYLSPGYWRQPELTAATFLPDPDGSDARLYRTGDLGRMAPDGCLIHLGRKDACVKIRGYSVGLPEIERVLRQHPALHTAVVLAQPDPAGETSLVAYVVPTQMPGPALSTLRDVVQQHLPDYMMPAAFVVLETLPLNPSGKVDLQQLPRPPWTRPPLDQPYVAPRTPIETTVAAIWAEVLGLEPVGMDDAFLALGGDSLRATRVITRVLATLHVTVSHQELLAAPTVAQMAMRVTQRLAEQVSAVELEALLADIEGDEVRQAHGL